MSSLALGNDNDLDDSQFYNRVEEISFISDNLELTEKGSTPTILLTGIRGVGKTALMKEEIQLNHILSLLNNELLIHDLKLEKRIIFILDNVPTHKSDFIFEVAKSFNIHLLFLPAYSPELNPIEGAWDYSKFHLKRKRIDTNEELEDNSIRLFFDITSGDSLYKTTLEQFIPQLI